MRRLLLSLLLPIALVSIAAAQPAAILSEEEARAEDAREYARLYGVDPAEAERRLRAQAESVAVTEEIRAAYGDRLAGIAVEHRPTLRIKVRLTGGEGVPDRLIRAGGMDVPVVFETGAPASAAQVVAAMRRHREAIRAIIDHRGMGLDPRTGSLVLMADFGDLRGKSPEAVAARVGALTGVPVRIRLLDRPPQDFEIAGGGRVEGVQPSDGRRYFCTTGFVVTDGARTGIVTAAHCPDSLSYVDPVLGAVPLEFVGGWGAQYQDVQVHVGPGDKPPLFRAAGTARPQQGRRLRARIRAGETVCHRGESSGYSCSEVELTDYAPPGDLCGGPCEPTWISVTGPACRNGDSGGPVFVGTTAFGILKGGNYAADGRCNFYYFMPIEFLPEPWSLLIAGGDRSPQALPLPPSQPLP